jgi:hypothetical protein
MADNGNLAELITDLKESLERELHSMDQKLADGFASITIRLDDQAASLRRHAVSWQTGRRWSAGMDDWAEKIDTALETKDREIAELRKRLTDVEDKLR